MEVYRIYEDVALYFFTFSVVKWLPVFVHEQSCLIVADSLNYCYQEKHLRINAFVIMPTHMHLIVFDEEFNSDRLQETIFESTEKTTRRGAPTEYMGVVAAQPPPYIPSGNLFGGFLQERHL